MLVQYVAFSVPSGALQRVVYLGQSQALCGISYFLWLSEGCRMFCACMQQLNRIIFAVMFVGPSFRMKSSSPVNMAVGHLRCRCNEDIFCRRQTSSNLGGT